MHPGVPVSNYWNHLLSTEDRDEPPPSARILRRPVPLEAQGFLLVKTVSSSVHQNARLIKPFALNPVWVDTDDTARQALTVLTKCEDLHMRILVKPIDSFWLKV